VLLSVNCSRHCLAGDFNGVIYFFFHLMATPPPFVHHKKTYPSFRVIAIPSLEKFYQTPSGYGGKGGVPQTRHVFSGQIWIGIDYFCAMNRYLGGGGWDRMIW